MLMLCAEWLLMGGSQSAETWLLQGIQGMMAAYFKSNAAETRSPVSITEADAWASEAER